MLFSEIKANKQQYNNVLRDGTRINKKMKTDTEWIGTAGWRINSGLTGQQ